MATPKNKKITDLPREYLIIMMESGYVYLAMQRFEEAMELFEGVVQFSPRSDVPRIAMGNVFSAQQKFEEALKEYKKAIKLDPKSALAHAHMGEVYLMIEDETKAKKSLEKAVELDPQGRSSDFARSLLTAMDKGILPLSQLKFDDKLPKAPAAIPEEKDK